MNRDELHSGLTAFGLAVAQGYAVVIVDRESVGVSDSDRDRDDVVQV